MVVVAAVLTAGTSYSTNVSSVHAVNRPSAITSTVRAVAARIDFFLISIIKSIFLFNYFFVLSVNIMYGFGKVYPTKHKSQPGITSCPTLETRLIIVSKYSHPVNVTIILHNDRYASATLSPWANIISFAATGYYAIANISDKDVAT